MCDKCETDNQELHRRVSLPNVVTQVHQRRLNLWYSIKARNLNKAVCVLSLILSIQQRTGQLTQRFGCADIVQVLSIDCNTWIERPTKIRVQNNSGRRPKLIGRQVITIVCTDVACARVLVTRKEFYRHVCQDNDSAGLTGTVGLPCPEKQCCERYRVEGWLNSHITHATLNYSLQ